MHLNIEVHSLSPKKWADPLLTRHHLCIPQLRKMRLFINFNEISGAFTGFRPNYGQMC